MKVKFKQDWQQKVLSDPFVSEAAWLPACQGTNTELSARQQNPLAKIAAALVPSALIVLCCAFISVAGFLSVHLGFDWGYYLVERCFGQTHGSSQGIMANIILFDIIAPLFFGLTFASFEAVRKKSWLVSIPVLVGLLFAENLIVNGTFHLLELMIYVGTASAFYFGGFFFSSTVLKCLKKRMRTAPILLTCASCLSIMGIISHFTAGSIGWFREMLLYSAVLFATGIFSVSIAKVKNKTAALLIPSITIAPLALANIINVIGTATSLFLDQFKMGFTLGWESLLSACIISTVTFASTSAGGLIALNMREKLALRSATTKELCTVKCTRRV